MKNLIKINNCIWKSNTCSLFKVFTHDDEMNINCALDKLIIFVLPSDTLPTYNILCIRASFWPLTYVFTCNISGLYIATLQP